MANVTPFPSAEQRKQPSAAMEHEEAMLDLYCITALLKLVAHDESDPHRGCVRDYLNEKLEETYRKLDETRREMSEQRFNGGSA
jgi:hypothetical protein